MTDRSEQGSSYAQILKSSAVIGGAQALVIVVGMVRSKAMALMLGPAGFGIMGIYTSIVDLAVSAAGLGISSSGVRQVAAATAANDTAQIERTVSVLRKTTWVLGVLGGCRLCWRLRRRCPCSPSATANTPGPSPLFRWPCCSRW